MFVGNGVSEQFIGINANEGGRGDRLIASEDTLRTQISDHIS
jgi:hypothetical protein